MSDTKPDSRTQLRNSLLGSAPQFITRRVKFKRPILAEMSDPAGNFTGYMFQGFEETPVEVEVRQPSIRQRNQLYDKCRDKDGNLDTMEFVLQSLIEFVYDPESGEHIFEQTDRDALLAQPAGGFVDQFTGVAMELLTLEEPEKN